MTESCPTVILRLQDWLSGRVLAIITKILMQIFENGKVKELNYQVLFNFHRLFNQTHVRIIARLLNNNNNSYYMRIIPKQQCLAQCSEHPRI